MRLYVPDHEVTAEAEQAAQAPAAGQSIGATRVIVIYTEILVRSRRIRTAQTAPAALLSEQLFVLLDSNPVAPHQVTCAVLQRNGVSVVVAPVLTSIEKTLVISVIVLLVVLSLLVFVFLAILSVVGLLARLTTRQEGLPLPHVELRRSLQLLTSTTLQKILHKKILQEDQSEQVRVHKTSYPKEE